MTSDYIITNVYSDTKLRDSGFYSGHGQSFHIVDKKSGKQIIFDIGTVGKHVVFNMNKLHIIPDEIDFLVISHGHYDHTLGLPEFLSKRTKRIQIIAHPKILEPKKALIKDGVLKKRVNIGAPKITKKQNKKITFKFVKEPYEIIKDIWLSGEIINRPHKDGTEERLQHKENKRWVKDPLIDDQSLIINHSKGLIIICGCCHSGLLNTIEHAKRLFHDKNIYAILGGTHMLNFTEEDLEKVADVLDHNFDKPILYLNHCTGNYAIDFLREKFGKDIVRPCHTGTILEF